MSRIHRITSRVIAASALGLGALAACASAAPASDGQNTLVGVSPRGEAPLAAKGEPSPKKDSEQADAGPRCPYGELSDPHRGFIRCLTPDERDADWLPPPPQKEPPPPPPPDGGSDAAPSSPPPAESAKPPEAAPPKPPEAAPPPAPPPLVEMSAPKFENGEVTRVDKALASIQTAVAKCVADNGGLSSATGSMKVQFLVRVRGRAEGVDVSKLKGISSEAGECVRKLLKNKAIGAPSADPVGVSFSITFKAAK